MKASRTGITCCLFLYADLTDIPHFRGDPGNEGNHSFVLKFPCFLFKMQVIAHAINDLLQNEDHPNSEHIPSIHIPKSSLTPKLKQWFSGKWEQSLQSRVKGGLRVKDIQH